jgi:hypothetical protein
MSSTLTRVSVGIVGVSPGLLLLETNLTHAEIQVPGFLNKLQPYTDVQVAPNDFVLANAADGSEYYVIETDMRIFTLFPAGGSGGGFNYDDTYWLAKNGNDTNGGNSIESPLLTFAHLQTLLIPGRSICINIVDNGTYSLDSFTIMGPTFINAPDASFNYSGVTQTMFVMPTLNVPLTIDCLQIDGTGTLNVFRGSGLLTTNIQSIINASNNIYTYTNAATDPAPILFIGNIDTSGGSILLSNIGSPKITGVNLGNTNIHCNNTTNPVTVNCVFFDGTINNLAGYIINASILGPNFTINTNAIGSITINAYEIRGNLLDTASPFFTVNVATNIDGNVVITGGGTASINVTGFIGGNLEDHGVIGDGLGYVYTNISQVVGTVSSDNQRIWGSIQRMGALTPESINNGFFDGVEYFNEYPVIGEIYSTIFTTPPSGFWSFVPGAQSSNQQIAITNTNGQITLPLRSTVLDGWRMTSIQTPRGGGALVLVQAPDTMIGQINSSSQCYTGSGKAEFIRGPANGGGGFFWIAAGNVFNTNLVTNTGNLYVSQDSGSDTLGDGSFNNPFATFGAAITAAGSPLIMTDIVGLDGATYAENVVINSPNISIVAPNAILSPSSGDALTIAAANTFTQYIFKQIVSSGGNSVNVSGSGSSIVTAFLGYSGDIACASYELLVTGGILAGNIVVASGEVVYQLVLFNGTITGTAFGADIRSSTYSTFTVKNFISDGLHYPTVDGTPGQAIVTDGAGTLSFATVGGGGGLTFNNVAGTNQLAAPNNAYVCQNAAQTTITLPLACSLGDTVRVYGQGAAGWILAANGGQTIQIGTMSTSVAGSLTSAANTDLVEVTCLVANTTWQVNFVFSTGLTIA